MSETFRFASSILFLCIVFHVHAQTARHFQWFNVGLGTSVYCSPKDFYSGGIVFDYYYLIRNKSTLQFGITAGNGLWGYPGFSSLYVGYGKSFISGKTLFGVYLAPTLNPGRTSAAENLSFPAGISSTLQAVYHPVFNVGLALEVFGQFTFKGSQAGIRLMLHFNNTNRKLE